MNHEGNKNSDKDSNGEQGGGIFSTPELSVNTENLPVAEAELSEDNKSRIAAAFQGTEASRKQAGAREMNEAAFARSDIPSTATGDIKLPSGKKKHKKAPLIILVALALLVIGGGVAWFGIQNGWFGGEASTAEVSSLDEARVAFARFANYLLFDEEKDPFDGEYDSTKIYALNERLNSGTYDEVYWNKAGDLLNIAADSLSESDIPEKNQLINALKNYRRNFDFVRVYNQVGDLDEDALIETFLTSGMDGVRATLDKFYANFLLLDSDIAKDYAEQRIHQYTDIMSLYGLYDELGCIHDGMIDESGCFATATPSVEQQNQLVEWTESSSQNRRSANNISQNAIRYVASYPWDFMFWLNNPIQYSDEGADE